ncbi:MULTISPECIES: hypothetical protein [Cupriavidus]
MTVFKTNSVANNFAGSKLYPIGGMTPSTVFWYAAANKASWPRQAAPQSGDVWENLVSPGTGDATFTTPGAFTWDAGSGFTTPPLGTTEKIILNGGAGLANQTKFLAMVHFVHRAQDVGQASGDHQILDAGNLVQLSYRKSDGSFRAYSGISSTGAALVLAAPVVGTEYMLHVAYDPATKKMSFYVNGATPEVASMTFGGTAPINPDPTAQVLSLGKTTPSSVAQYCGTYKAAAYDTLASGGDVATLVKAAWASR